MYDFWNMHTEEGTCKLFVQVSESVTTAGDQLWLDE